MSWWWIVGIVTTTVCVAAASWLVVYSRRQDPARVGRAVRRDEIRRPGR